MKDEKAGDERRVETHFIHDPDPQGHGNSYALQPW
jgi:hypothetical protein